ncbi:Acyltransferase [Secundilactobacillus paracollinoides DSM 15502 = JCM 11969]|nr:Acyltransferase [Secundilactobacillus paracollinoides DSM 15502 = JCM 11969]
MFRDINLGGDGLATKTKRPYLYEVDLMRVIFIFGVLLNHTTTVYMAHIVNTSNSQTFLEATHLILHFTRMGFMFMSGLVLTLNYYNREPHWVTFWKKRFSSSGIPYLAWDAIIHGDQFYMYYILVTLQLYVLFPLLVMLFKKMPNSHAGIMVVSFIIQIFLMIGIKYWLPHVDTSHWWFLFKNYGENVLVYQFYFLFGAFVSIHYKEVDKFIGDHAKAIGFFTAVLALGTVALYWCNIHILKLSMAATMSVHQPYMLVYDTVMIIFVFWVGRRYAYARQHGLWPWVDRWIHNGAKVSFGIYLVQMIPLTFLTLIMNHIHMPAWLLVLCLPIGYAFVAGGAFLISWFCYKVPPFGVLIGRPQIHFKRKPAPVSETGATKK